MQEEEKLNEDVDSGAQSHRELGDSFVIQSGSKLQAVASLLHPISESLIGPPIPQDEQTPR